MLAKLIVIASVAFGGAIGAVARYAIAEGVRVATSWPPYVGTVAANVAGCFAIGIAFSWLEEAGRPEHDWVRPLVVTGLLGAFTTFSTFGLDAMHLIEHRHFGQLAAYVVGSVLLGLIAVKVGMMVLR